MAARQFQLHADRRETLRQSVMDLARQPVALLQHGALPRPGRQPRQLQGEGRLMTETRPLIVHVIHHLVTGGMENGLVSLINNLPSSGYRHAIVCIEDHSDFREPGHRRSDGA